MLLNHPFKYVVFRILLLLLFFFLSFQKISLKKSFYGDNDIYGSNVDNALEHITEYKA